MTPAPAHRLAAALSAVLVLISFDSPAAPLAVATAATAMSGETVQTQPTQTRVDRLRELLTEDTDNGVLVVAHRGHHANYPENSIGSITDAADLGCHMIELDVRETNDGHFVLMHDSTVDRTTNGSGKMSDFSLASITRLSLMDGIRITTERVPTMRDALEAARGRILVNLDLKGVDLARVAREAQDIGMLDHCLFKVTWTEQAEVEARRTRAEIPGVMIMPLVRTVEQLDRALADDSDLPIEFVLAEGTEHMTEAHLSRVRAAGRRPWANSLGHWNIPTMNDHDFPDRGPRVFTDLARRGFTMIQTDIPDHAMPALDGAGLLPD